MIDDSGILRPAEQRVIVIANRCGKEMTEQDSTDRYSDPFIRILELYVLKAVGALSREDADAMKKITPELQSIYGHGAGWTRIVEHVMEFPREAQEEIRALWLERKEEVAQTEGRRLHPEEFAREFTDRCFADDDDEA